MSGFSNVMKGGWHPEGKGGRKESWRNDFKGINQVAGWMGKGKDPNESEKSEHVSRPLSSLKDPGSFAPPPTHINYHGAAAVPNQTTPDRSGIGAPLTQNQVDQQNAHQEQALAAEQEEAEKPKPPPVPYRVNTTGLSTENLPPPPVRRLESPSSGSSTNTAAASKPKPSLPPRVPPRNLPSQSQDDVPPPAYTPVAPQQSDGYINQEATSRLANAGVSVPALGIGEANGQSQAQTTAGDAPVNELQSRFSNMQTGPASRAHQDKIDMGKHKLSGAASGAKRFVDDYRSPSAAPGSPSHASGLPRDTQESLPPPQSKLQQAQAFKDKHQDKIDMGKQKLSGAASGAKRFVDDYRSPSAAPATPPTPASPSHTSGLPRDTQESLPPPQSKLQQAQAFKDKHQDKIDLGKQKLSGAASGAKRYVDDYRSPSATPASPSHGSGLPPRDAEDALPPAQGLRERHADKIDFGKQKLGGVTSRFNTMVEDHKFNAAANKRMPRPPGPSSPATSSPVAPVPVPASNSPARQEPALRLRLKPVRRRPSPAAEESGYAGTGQRFARLVGGIDTATSTTEHQAPLSGS
ncbi:hypothetical protein N7509_011609 [Penicillium cosmopolitanum]|uniref:Altered inheritance of mitochondria protein 3 n=1 Tax=Penicillium cosmopolitanum TaxID=1131564 RepID=A0A9W9VGC3_9EURO|nr:uncharacterized protein N7509_011609 [Penicillium cosmopolitanum]KAJ5378490.1 hypothetical protein N7509_011609 [Penicillium cosmopolitanum]